MNNLRAEMVAKARKMGICTQCLKRKVATGRKQCVRCIETNRRKQKRRKLEKCPTCGRALPPAKKYPRPPEKVREYNRRYKEKQRLKKKLGRKPKYTTEEQRREARRKYQATYRKKKLYKKVRNLAVIRHAVAKEKLVEKKRT